MDPAHASPMPTPTDSLASRQVEEMVAAWRRGEPIPAEALLDRHPGLGGEATIRLIFEEYCLRQEAGMEVDPLEFARRFPRWWPELEMLFDCRDLMEPGAAPAELPGVGEEVAGFRLLAELGRGAAGSVFLASELALADRPVVLKVTTMGREEHLSLARLQHMNIVPLYSERMLEPRRLQVLCMPFLGGASLSEILDLMKVAEPSSRTGRQVVEALDRVQGRLPVALPARGPFRPFLARSSYVDAICWIGACLADGLHYAHERNFVHMDIKPSNVLIAGDGQPMLLDFHLAREPLAPGDPLPLHLGGTPGHMAPEQVAAMASVHDGRPILKALDGRADIYALGVLLDEALGGPSPKPDDGPRRPLRGRNPRVTPGLAAIIERCLKPDPADRYQDAAALATDLRRFLDGLPLKGVPNRSPRERWRNWRRRRPHALTRGLILLASTLTLLAAASLAWAGYLQRVHEAEAALREGRAALDRRQHPEAIKALRRGLALADHLPATGRLRRELAEGIARARRDARADDLHRLAELIRFRYGIDPPPPDEAHALIRRGEDLWRDRAILGGSDDQIRADLLDFVLAWINLRVRSAAPGEADRARREALETLNEARTLLGPDPSIDRELGVHGEPSAAPAPDPEPTTAGEHFERGKSHLRAGETGRAVEEFGRGLDLRPQDFWLNFYQGLCAYRLGRPEEAVHAFRVCIALAPDSAECYFNRALALGSLGRAAPAIDDYTRALRLDPALGIAALNRGILRYQAGDLAGAAADLNRALAGAPGSRDRGIIHYNLSLVDMARGDRPAALANLEKAASYGHEGAKVLRARLRESTDGGPKPGANRGDRRYDGPLRNRG